MRWESGEDWGEFFPLLTFFAFFPSFFIGAFECLPAPLVGFVLLERAGGLTFALDEKAEVFEFHRQVYVVDHDIFGNVKDNRGEIQNPGDAILNQSVDHFLCGSGRHGDDGHSDSFFLDDFRQFFQRINRLFDRFFPFSFWIEIKRGNDFKPFLFKSPVRKQRQTEVSDPDQNDRLQAVGSQEIGDHLPQLPDIVTEATGPELTKISKILAELG